jgi:hypothetical protein
MYTGAARWYVASIDGSLRYGDAGNSKGTLRLFAIHPDIARFAQVTQ